jgi:hypothetical protein
MEGHGGGGVGGRATGRAESESGINFLDEERFGKEQLYTPLCATSKKMVHQPKNRQGIHKNCRRRHNLNDVLFIFPVENGNLSDFNKKV